MKRWLYTAPAFVPALASDHIMCSSVDVDFLGPTADHIRKDVVHPTFSIHLRSTESQGVGIREMTCENLDSLCRRTLSFMVGPITKAIGLPPHRNAVDLSEFGHAIATPAILEPKPPPIERHHALCVAERMCHGSSCVPLCTLLLDVHKMTASSVACGSGF